MRRQVRHRCLVFVAMILCGAIAGAPAPAADAAAAAPAAAGQGTAGPFQPDWESLKAHPVPEWFRDAKFGIYTHWGPVTAGCEEAPSGMEWYGRQMYDEKHPAFKYHQQKFGDQKTVGYKDVIPHFRAEKFDAEAWADLFARAGARFAGPVAVHHDNFAMWDSAVTRWNSMAMGPKRDITGELQKAIRAKGLKFITTFHHGFAWRYYEPAYKFDAADPQFSDLYGEPHAPGAPPSPKYLDKWLAMVDEAVGKYRPDLIWFDFELGTLIPDEYRRQMFAHYYNWAARDGREVGVAHKHREIHQYTGILDFERGREDRLTEYPWLTDTSIGPWFHHNAIGYRPVDQLVDVLVDIVSKNGCMLLNVGPQADGRIPDKAQAILLAIGGWLKVNGEAIYGTRPWAVYGEGPTRGGKRGGFSEGKDRPFTARDIRFTTKGGVLYAIALAWPEDGQLLLKSLAPPADPPAGKIARVELLGAKGDLKWARGPEGLAVTLPAEKPCDYAVALRITGENLRAAPVTYDEALLPGPDGSVQLDPIAAELHGSKIRVEEKHNHSYIAAWDNAKEWVSWPVRFPAKGTYAVSIICSAAAARTAFVVELAGRKLDGTAARTPTWYDYQTLNLGTVEVPQAGRFDLAIRARDAARWKALNVRSVKLTRVGKE